MENEKLLVLGQDSILKNIDEKIKELKKGRGNLILIGGSTGSGKTYLLDYIEDKTQQSIKEIRTLRVRVPAPIFDFKAGNLEQLKPFINILQELEKPETKKELYKEIAVSSLASMPIIGEFVYPYKEIKRNIDEYNKSKMVNSSNLGDAFYNFFFDSVNKKLKNRKLLILIDDFHYADFKSVNFLINFIEENNSNAIILATYTDTFLNNNITSPLNSFFENISLKEKYDNQILQPLGLEDIRELSKFYFENYYESQEFENWILEKTDGNPSIVVEYLKHFSKTSPFDSKGNLVTNFKENEFLPQSWKQLFTQQMEEISEEDIHILTICASEGVEFTATIVSKLLSLDVVTAIKKLRKIIQKTNLIKSLGVQLKYGIQTTTYTFTHSFYQSYFKQTLEYEENLELQSKISELLKIQYVSLNDDDMKQELALQLAAHSIESGDTETAKEALHYAAQSNQEIGGDEFLDSIQSVIKEIDPNASNLISSIESLKMLNSVNSIDGISADGFTNNAGSETIIDFKNLKKIVLNDMINDNYLVAINKLNIYLSNHAEHFNDEEKIQFGILLSKSYLDTKMIKGSKLALDNAEKLISRDTDPNIIVLLNNGFAYYYYITNELDISYNYLKKYEEYYHYLSADTKILTFALASQIFKNHKNASKFKSEAIKLSEMLNFNDLKNELNNF